MNHHPGFTLADMLMSLLILAVISTFTIPKVLTAQQNGRGSALAKEVAGMLSAAYAAVQTNSTISSNTTATELTPYMNYLASDTSTATYNFTDACGAYSGAAVCLKLHGGGVLQYRTTNKFCGSSVTDAQYWNFDPDGSGSLDFITFVIYYNGRVTTFQQKVAGTSTCNNAAARGTDPSWFSW